MCPAGILHDRLMCCVVIVVVVVVRCSSFQTKSSVGLILLLCEGVESVKPSLMPSCSLALSGCLLSTLAHYFSVFCCIALHLPLSFLSLFEIEIMIAGWKQKSEIISIRIASNKYHYPHTGWAMQIFFLKITCSNKYENINFEGQTLNLLISHFSFSNAHLSTLRDLSLFGENTAIIKIEGL